MWNPTGIIILYNEVLWREVTGEIMWEYQIRNGLQEITLAYKPGNLNLSSSKRVSVNFNKKAARCAYVHRFASLYTGLVYEMLSLGLRNNYILHQFLSRKLHSHFQLCCLGGGPGTDLVGVWSALYHFFGPSFYGSATVVDKMCGWADTVNSVMVELQTRYYPVSHAFNPLWFDWSFLTADLMGDLSARVRKTIGSADMITMFKFLSATACEDTEKMLLKIFDIMKPGALVFFIDNASGGYHELVNRVAEKSQFSSVLGPWCHTLYYNEAFNVIRFGNQSLWKTTVTVQILRKPGS